MQLHHRFFPGESDSNEPPLIVLHGVFGSRNNWSSAARQLAGRRDVYTADLRNHGDSPHADSMTLKDMAGDVRELIAAEQLQTCRLLGHSLGGKVAMQLAFDEPALVDRLIVVDIAPRSYPPRHQAIFEAIDAIDREQPADRREAEQLIAPIIPEQAVRLFLLTNLTRSDQGGPAWRINTQAIRENYEAISAPPQAAPGAVFSNPTLFIRGGRSNYIGEDDEPLIRRLFPQVKIHTLDAGHWAHVDAPDAFINTVEDFLG